MANGESAQIREEMTHLRVLVANEKPERLELLRQVLSGLGHEVVGSEIEVDEVGPVTRRERPDVALVGLGEAPDHALQMIGKIVHEAACPVIALLTISDPGFVNEAAKRGIFAYIHDDDPEALQSSLDIVLRRFAEYHNLEGAFARRAMIERAKGILMATHRINEQQAFDLLRTQSRNSGRKLFDLAAAVVDSHELLAANSTKET